MSAFTIGFNVGGGEMRRINNNAQALDLSPQQGRQALEELVTWQVGNRVKTTEPQRAG